MTLMFFILLLLGLGVIGYFNYRCILKAARRLEKKVREQE